MHGAMAMLQLTEERGEPLVAHDFERWTDPVDDEARRRRGAAAFEDIHGVPPEAPTTPFRARAELDFLYGEIWTRRQHLTRRDRRIVTICCAGAAGVDDETSEHLRAALALGDLTLPELEELVVHYAVYLGWNLGRRLDELLEAAAATVDRR